MRPDPENGGRRAPERSEGDAALGSLFALQERDRLQALVAGQFRVLEMIAQGAPLSDTLDALMRVLEGQADGMLCSVLLLTDDGRRVRNGASPSLPAAYRDAIEDQPIGPRAGSCGTAAFLRRQVIVADIGADPLWALYKDVALAAGLRACWSTPILSRRSEVLGTFAIYYREPKEPDPLHLHLITQATHLAGVAIERTLAERERQRLMTELDVDRQALANEMRHKDQFMAMLAHELRNPLAAIGNAVEVARLRLARGQAVADPLGILERQVKNCGRLLDDLLDVARFARGLVQLHREPVRLQEVVEGAVEAQRGFIERHGHRLTLELPDRPVVVDGDATRLEQVVSNLLNNAAKYCPDGSHIDLQLRFEPGEAVLRVQDDGAGITADLLPHLFDPFVQADRSLARAQGGLGLGLALVRDLVRVHGGTVTAASEGPGKGSEFTVRLPARLAPEEPPERPAPAAAPGVEPREESANHILVVEDNEDVAETLSEALGSCGHDVRVVHEGASALALVARWAPDLVLIDIGLPGMDGYELARRLRALASDRPPVLMALTGYGQDEDRERSRAAGMEYHLTKPFALPQLEHLIAEVLERPRATRAQ